MNTKKICKKLVRDAHAVSPIIATLMLVLVAVGSAGAFYAWQTGWQKDNTEALGDFDGKSMLTIGGSSTVYEFTAVAAPMFEKEYSSTKVNFMSGGSGAGVTAVGQGIVDIGSSSDYLTSEQKALYPDLVQYTVALDAVVMVVSKTNTHGVTQLTTGEIRAIYYLNSDPAIPVGDLPTDVSDFSTDPATSGNDTTGPALGEIYYNTNLSKVCWTNSTTPINIYERLDKSGTEEVFCNGILGEGQKQLDTYGITAIEVEGNQNLVLAIEGDADGLGFMSYGIAKEADVDILDVSWDGGTTYIEPKTSTILDYSYEGFRPITYITNGPARGEAKAYIDFCMLIMNNKDISDGCGYISLFA